MSDNFRGGLLAASILMGFFGVGVAAMWMVAEAPPPCAPEIHTRGQSLRIEMDELGFYRWQMACAFAVAKDGRSLSQAEKQCNIVWPKDDRP